MSVKIDSSHQPQPFINVTPLIDVLLVLLIIFMVVTPLKPARFETKLPAPPDDKPLPPNPWTLVVSVDADRKLKLNDLTEDLGTIDDMGKLSAKLVETFNERIRNHSWRWEMMTRPDLADDLRIEKTVFIKAPRSIDYGEVAKLIDGLKGAGAAPIGLQLDDLK